MTAAVRSSQSSRTRLWLSRLLLLIVDQIGGRFRRSRLSVLIAIGEPLGVVAVFWFLQRVVGGAHGAPFGSSLPLFYLTGVLPFYLFFHTSLRLRNWDGMQRRPLVSEFDLLLSLCIAELLSKIIIIAICLIAFYLNGVLDSVPRNPLICVVALVCLLLLGAIVGILNAVIIAFFATWTYIYQVAIRAWIAFSGVLFVVDYMPLTIRTAASWIPVTHAVILYRVGHYEDYPHFVLSMQYLFWTIAAGGLLAWVLEVATREWRPA